MKVIERKFRYDMGQRFRFVVFSDLHLGNRLCSLRNFQDNLINRYKNDKEALFIDLGDGLDLIVAQTNDKRFQASMVDERYLGIDNPIDVMIDDYCQILEPIKDRIIAMTDSNHHLEIEKRTGTSPTRRIAWNLFGKDMEKKMLGYAGFLVTRFGNGEHGKHRVKSLTWSLCHGIGTGGKTEGGFKTTLGNDAINYDCDVACYAHNHQLDGWSRIVLGVDRFAKRVVSSQKIRLNSGSYLKGFSDDDRTSYVERARMKPNALGHMECSVKLSTDSMETYYVKRMVL